MQVEENYVQDVIKDSTTRGWSVKKSVKMDDTISVSKFGKTSTENSVKREAMGYQIDTNYNTLWSVVFTMDPVKKINREVWLV